MKTSVGLISRIASSVCLIAGTASPQAGTLLVYNTHDSGAGSLRQAIADNRSLGGGNTIVFSNVVAGTIKLTTGELLISNNVTILGLGSSVLAVNGNQAGRVFNFYNTTATIFGLTITNGKLSNISGAGILNDNTILTISNCTISGNSAYYGGGIYSLGRFANASLSIIGCTISGNSASDGGGGICNTAYSTNATLSVIASTIHGNTSATYGGGIYNQCVYGSSIATLSVSSCTFSGNSGGSSADSIYNSVYYSPSMASATLTLGDTILKAGTSGINLANDNSGIVHSLGYNLCSDNGGGYLTALGDQINSDPMLGPLQDNGGPTPTMIPLPGSPAIDQGKNLTGLATDQHGRYRTFDNPSTPNATGGDGTDIGAVEVSPAHNIVGTTGDVAGDTLRYCIADAQPGDTITFSNSVIGPITLTRGQLLINKNLTIQGPGAKVVAVNGNATSRVFYLTSGVTVAISGLTITNGNATDYGGGIYNDHSTLTVRNCTLSGNSAGSHGGALFNNGQASGSASLSLITSTLSGNSANQGGGIYTVGFTPATATLSVLVSTLSGNSATDGGGIFNYNSTLSLTAVTLGGNSAAQGGGIFNLADPFNSAPVTIGDSVLQAGTSGENIYNNRGAVTSLGFNLSSDGDVVNVQGGSGSLNATGDQINVDPMLGRLQDNGGPTPTMALLSGSPAIDQGKSFGLATDQRGEPRSFDWPLVPDAAGGDGSDAGAFERGSPRLNIQHVGSSAVLSWPSYYDPSEFSLQSSTDIPSSDNWATAPGTPSVIGTEYLQTNNPISNNKFFRLKSN